MAEINLLPSDLREKEQKELETARKKSRPVNIELTNPKIEKLKEPAYAAPRQSILSRLFAKKIETPKSLSSFPNQERQKPIEKMPKVAEKNFHIPSLPIEKSKVRIDLSGNEDATAQKETFETDYKLFNDESGKDKVNEKKEDQVKIELNKLPPKKKSFSFSGLFFGKKIKSEDDRSKPVGNFVAREKKAGKVKNKSRGFKREKTDILDVNLIPAELGKRPELELGKRLFASGAVILGFILLIAAGYLGITWYQVKVTQDISGVESRIETLDQEIVQYEKDKQVALDMQQSLESVRQLLNQHVYWTNFFNLLEKNTIGEVKYVNFSMAGQNKLVISAFGKDYHSVAKQLIAFQKATDFVKNVKIDAASAEIDPETGNYTGVNFNIDLEFQPNVFLKPIE
ncbi:MAG: hypothetical protein WC508_02330 [Patescibacteria group bacterium]